MHFETNGALNTIDDARGIEYNSINILILPIPKYEVYQKFAVGDWYFDNATFRQKVNAANFCPLDANAGNAVIILFANVINPHKDINPKQVKYSQRLQLKMLKKVICI